MPQGHGHTLDKAKQCVEVGDVRTFRFRRVLYRCLLSLKIFWDKNLLEVVEKERVVPKKSLIPKKTRAAGHPHSA